MNNFKTILLSICLTFCYLTSSHAAEYYIDGASEVATSGVLVNGVYRSNNGTFKLSANVIGDEVEFVMSTSTSGGRFPGTEARFAIYGNVSGSNKVSSDSVNLAGRSSGTIRMNALEGYLFARLEITDSGNSFVFFTTSSIRVRKVVEVSPIITRVYSSPGSAVAGSAFTFYARLDRGLPSGWSLSVDFGAGYKNMSGSGALYSEYASAVNSVGQNRTIRARLRDDTGSIRDEASGTYDVTEPVATQYAPNLSLTSSTGAQIEVGTTYCVTLRATDQNDNLRNIQVNWGDGVLSDPYSYSAGSGDVTREFCHEYAAGTKNWSATVHDHSNKTDTVAGSVVVVEVSPTITSVYSSPGSAVAGSAFTFYARLDRALPGGWNLSVDFGAGYKNMSGSGTLYSEYASAVNSVGQNRFIRVRLRDDTGAIRDEASGTYDVTEPIATQYAPDLSLTSSTGAEIEVGTIYCVTLRATDQNDNLRNLQVNWGDGVLSDPYSYSAGSGDVTREFCHEYAAGTKNWSATVHDHSSKTDTVTGSVVVIENIVNITAFLNSDSIIERSNLFSSKNLQSEFSRAEAAIVLDGFLRLLNPDFGIEVDPAIHLVSFPDVDRWQDYALAVTRLVNYFGDDTTSVIDADNKYFYPLRAVSRAEFLGMLFQGLNYEASSNDYNLSAEFSDANFSQAPWAERYFASAVNLGLIQGEVRADGKYLKPFDALSVQESLYILAAARGKPSIAQHDSIGFSFQVDTQIYSKTAGSEYISFKGFTSTVGISNLSISQSDVEIEGMICRELKATSNVDTAAGGSARYFWRSTAGYFYGVNSREADEVILCPAGETTTPYIVQIVARDSLGFSIEDKLSIPASLLSAANYQSIAETEIEFSGWAGVTVSDEVIFGEPITLDLSSVGYSKGQGALVGHADIVVRLYDSGGRVLVIENTDSGVLSLDTSQLENLSRNYTLELEVTLNDEIHTTSLAERLDVEIIPAVRVFGQVQVSAGYLSTPQMVSVNAVNVDVVDNSYSVVVSAVSVGDTIEISVPSSVDSNLYLERTLTVIEGVSEYRENLLGVSVLGEPVPEPPELLSPANGDVVAANAPITLKFNEVGDALRYEVRMYDLNSSSWVYSNDQITSSACSDAVCEVVADEMGVQNSTFWNVRAYNSSGWGDWSANGYFSVADPDFDGDGVPDATDPDDDNDGMSDAYELDFGLNPLDPNDASEDLDGDGFTNLEEAHAGSNPNETDSVPNDSSQIARLALNCGYDVLPGGWVDCGMELSPLTLDGVNGITVNLHFDSSAVYLATLSGLYQQGLIGFDVQPQADDGDLDGNAATDKLISIRWESNSQWLNTTAPVNLGAVTINIGSAVDSPATLDFGFSTTQLADQFFAVQPALATVSIREESTCTGIFTLEPMQWGQISLPCLPSGDRTLSAVFGDEGLGDYGTDWVLWEYDAIAGVYSFVELGDDLQMGVAYWILQTSGERRFVSLPQDSAPIASAHTVSCPHDASLQCYELYMQGGELPTTWNMVGVPIDRTRVIREWSVLTSGLPCDAAPCSYDQAIEAGLLGAALFHYRREDYKVFKQNEVTQPWAGYWAAVLGSGVERNLRLYVPTE